MIAVVFQNTVLLILFPLVAISLIIHLLNKKRPQVVNFPDFKLIRKAVAKRSRMLKLRHHILLLLRRAALAMLFVAFLYPVRQMFGSKDGYKGKRNVVIIYDHSLSLSYINGSLRLMSVI